MVIWLEGTIDLFFSGRAELKAASSVGVSTVLVSRVAGGGNAAAVGGSTADSSPNVRSFEELHFV